MASQYDFNNPAYWASFMGAPSATSAGGLGAPADPYDVFNPRALANPTYAYNYATGVDPQYDAWLSSYQDQTRRAQDDAGLRRGLAQDQEQVNDQTIDRTAATSRRNLESQMLARGAYNSGETGVRQGELEANVLGQHSAAATQYQQTAGQAWSDLQNAIASLDSLNLQHVDEAVGRQTQKQRDADAKAAQDAAAAAAGDVPAAASGGGGGGGGGGDVASGGGGGGGGFAAPAAAASGYNPPPPPTETPQPKITGSIAPGVGLPPKITGSIAPGVSIAPKITGSIAPGVTLPPKITGSIAPGVGVPKLTGSIAPGVKLLRKPTPQRGVY